LFDARVTDNGQIADLFGLISLTPLSDIYTPQAGQFFMLEAARGFEPLLKRPFSIFRYSDEGLQFLYRIRGKGTRCISKLRKDDVLQVLGPLGNTYPPPSGDFIVLAGGIGIASVYPLLERYPGRSYVYCGSRSCDELLMFDEIKRLSKEVCVTTDDGSFCRSGLITEPFREFIESAAFTGSPLPIYACGPTPMLKVLSDIIEENKLECYVSLEEVMACGVGACLGCVCKTTSGYRRICKEGPVFKIGDIVWE
jgi:dihydroorotate dehydrogenase electron transfer subunit